jgi:hypothetical protein
MSSMMIPRRRLVAMTAAAVAAMLVSACPSSSQSGSGGNSDGTASGSPVKIMVTGVLATPSANYAESANGAQALRQRSTRLAPLTATLYRSSPATTTSTPPTPYPAQGPENLTSATLLKQLRATSGIKRAQPDPRRSGLVQARPARQIPPHPQLRRPALPVGQRPRRPAHQPVRPSHRLANRGT